MDNKNDRKFYWEVKDFMKSGINKTPEQPKTNKLSIANSAKAIMEQNNVFKQKPIPTNNNTINAVGQVIGAIQKQEFGYIPQNKGFTKNLDKNFFQSLKEGWWDQLMAIQRQNSRRTEESDQNSVESGEESLEDLLNQIDQQETTPGIPLTPEQMAVRKRAEELQRQRALETLAQEDEEAEAVGSTIVRQDGRTYSTKPIGVEQQPSKTPETPAVAGVDVEGPPTPTAEEERAAQAQVQAQKDAAELKSRTERLVGRKEKETTSKISKLERDIDFLTQMGPHISNSSKGGPSRSDLGMHRARLERKYAEIEGLKARAERAKPYLEKRAAEELRVSKLTPEQKAAEADQAKKAREEQYKKDREAMVRRSTERAQAKEENRLA